MKNLSQIGSDAGQTVFPIDWKQFHQEVLIKNYLLQPLVVRKLGGTLIPLQFDGKVAGEIPIIEEGEDPNYGMKPIENATEIQGGVIQYIAPQLSKTIDLEKDQLKMMFAGRSRLPLIINQILEQFSVWEDIIGFRGDTNTGVKGLISTDTHDMGAPTGAWGVDTGSNGILDNAKTDLDAMDDYFISQGVPPGARKNIVLTSYLYTLFKNTKLAYQPTMSFLDLVRSTYCNGGDVYVTNNLQANVTATSNTCLMVVDDPRAFALLSTNIEQTVKDRGLWSISYGLREKFAVKVLNKSGEESKFIAWMDGISNATS